MTWRVFVTDGQLRSALAVVRSLGRRDVTVTCGESTRFATAFFSKYTDTSVVYPSPEDEPGAFREFLLSYLEANEIDALLPVGHHATKIVSEYRGLFTEHTQVPTPEYERFSRALDKRTTLEAAKRASVPIPETRFPNSVDEAAISAEEIGYPVVIKPRTGHGSRGLHFIDSPSAFRELYEEVHAVDPFPLIQEALPRDGDGIGTSFLVSKSGDIKAEFAYRRLREYPTDGGPSTLRESISGKQVLEYGRQLLAELDWEGIAMVEFKIDTRVDEPRLMEVNPRFWGSLHLPLYAGVDFPWLVLQYTLDEPIDETLSFEVGIQCRYLLFGDLLNLLARRDFRAVREFLPLRAEDLHYDILDADDPNVIGGRLLAMARFAFSPKMWQRAVLRNQ